MIEKAVELDHIGGVYSGNIKPTPFLCLTLKLLQLQPDKEIILEYIKNEDFKSVACALFHEPSSKAVLHTREKHTNPSRQPRTFEQQPPNTCFLSADTSAPWALSTFDLLGPRWIAFAYVSPNARARVCVLGCAWVCVCACLCLDLCLDLCLPVCLPVCLVCVRVIESSLGSHFALLSLFAVH